LSHGGGNELLAHARLALDEHSHARVGDLVDLGAQVAHRGRVADDLLRAAAAGAARLLAALEEGVLLLEPVFRGPQARHEARVGHGERGVVREHRHHLEVRGREDARALAVVELQDAQDVLAAPERHGERRADRRAHHRLGVRDLGRRVRRDDRRALRHDLAEHAPRDRDGRRALRLPANARRDRHVPRDPGARALLVVVAQDDRHVRRLRHEREARVGDRHDDLVQVARRADRLLRRVQLAHRAGVALDAALGGRQVVDLANRDDARVLLDLQGEREERAALARAELDLVAVLQRYFARDRVVHRDARIAADDVRAVRRALVAQQILFAVEEDLRVLAGDEVVPDDDVVALRTPEAHEVGGRLEDLADRLPLLDLEPDHDGAVLPIRERRYCARARRRMATFATTSSAIDSSLLPLAVSAATTASRVVAAAASPFGARWSIAVTAS
jgi:hypothetical protein